MIGFFSRATGVEYPFEKYDQIAVRDFIFGGQENVSATSLTDAALHDAQAERDDPTTLLVAHELGQHWFGDYVQGRDWADIWLNEGFATYMTALYTQYHESNDDYRYEIYSDQEEALQVEASRAPRPIVDRKYVDPLDMLEEITHDKGAAVLDMMRYVVDGDAAMQSPASQNETLFQGLNYYLTTHAAHSADTSELLQSIWTRTGRELSWFFDEWVYKGGHPDYRVSATYDPTEKCGSTDGCPGTDPDCRYPDLRHAHRRGIFRRRQPKSGDSHPRPCRQADFRHTAGLRALVGRFRPQ